MTQISTRDGRENATRNQSPLARINPSTKSHSNLYARYFLHGSDYKCHKAKPHQQCSKEQSLKNIKKKKRKRKKKTIRKTTYKLEFNKIMEGEEYSASPPPPPAATKIESLACPEVLQNPRKKKKNKRRFSEEQIRSLESMFESETKLEPRKKVQLARELGLQPRQIAIWFQNRRARWKSKQIEQNYRVLKANYDSLLSRFESLKKEKQSLLKQLKMLGDLLEKTHDQGSKSKDLGGNSTSGDSDSGEPSCLKKGSDRGAVADSDGDEGGSGKNIQQEATEFLNMGGQVDASLALPEKSCNFESSSLFDGNSTWWDFWT